MTPTNLTECLQWLNEVQAFGKHLQYGPAFNAWIKSGSRDNFANFAALKVADFLRSHLQGGAIKAPAPEALALAREDLGRCMRLAGMQGLVSREEFEKLRTRIVYAIASVPKPQAEAELLTVPGPLEMWVGLDDDGGVAFTSLDHPGPSAFRVHHLREITRPQPEAAPALTWTREKPKVEGWYCWRPVGGGGLAVAEVRMFTGAPCWHSNERKAWVAVWPGLEWAGPVIPKDSDLEDEA